MNIVAKFILIVCGIFISTASYAGLQCPVIPLPNNSENVNESFVLNTNTIIKVRDDQFESNGYYLKNSVLSFTGISVCGMEKKSHSAIVLKQDKSIAEPEGYRITMDHRQVTVKASTDAGMFYGITSLLQLIMEADSLHQGHVKIACWNIEDAPQFRWRGFMLDESRHFFGKEEVKKLLDVMAMFKLNRFHWHLTDEPGWRLEIKQYPKLSLVGGIGNYSDSLAPARFYTQDDIREIVQYAKSRHITVIPEIDMPGHASAANRAYPEYRGGGSAKHPDFTFNPGKKETYQYLSNILKEVSILFPSNMIHIGGDEVSFGNQQWHQDQGIQKLMREKGFTGLKQVENYFIAGMIDSLSQLGVTALGWDEITHAPVDPDKAIVFWWRHDKPEELKAALDNGFRVVVCPRLPFYLDFVQRYADPVGRRWGGKYNTLKDLYYFSLDSFPVQENQLGQILGIQCNLWTERVSSNYFLEYMTFPRLVAMAESAWTSKDKQADFDGFLKRLKGILLYFDKKGVGYCCP